MIFLVDPLPSRLHEAKKKIPSFLENLHFVSALDSMFHILIFFHFRKGKSYFGKLKLIIIIMGNIE